MFNLIPAQSEGISSVAVNGSRTLLAASSLSGHIHMLSLPSTATPTPVEIGRLQGHQGAVNCVLFLDDTTLVSGSDDRCVRVWNGQAGECLHTSAALKDSINKIAPIVIGGNTIGLVCGCDDGMVVTLTVPEMEVCDRFLAASDTINDVVVVPRADGQVVLLTASEDGAVRVWSMPHIDAAGQKVIPGDISGEVAMEDRLLNSIDEFTAPVNHILLTFINGPTEAPMLIMASGENIYGARLNVFTGTFVDEETLQWGGHDDYVRGLHLLDIPGQGGLQLLTVSDDTTAVVQPLIQGADTAAPLRRYKLHNEMVMALSATSDGGVVVTGSEDGSARLWTMPFPHDLDVVNLPSL